MSDDPLTQYPRLASVNELLRLLRLVSDPKALTEAYKTLVETQKSHAGVIADLDQRKAAVEAAEKSVSDRQVTLAHQQTMLDTRERVVADKEQLHRARISDAQA